MTNSDPHSISDSWRLTMDLAMQEVRNGILLDGSQIYRPTTSTIVETILPVESRSTQTVTNSNGQQTVSTSNGQQTVSPSNGQQINPDGLFSSNSTDISKKETADLYFDNISYTVKLGFRKGMWFYNEEFRMASASVWMSSADWFPIDRLMNTFWMSFSVSNSRV